MRLKRFLVVLAVLAGAAVVAPASPASAALPACHGAFRFEGNIAPAGRVWIPTQYHGHPDGRNCIMGLGYHNWGVYFLQVTLQQCYGQDIVADARFGPATREALRNAQRIHRLADDGIYGPNTRRALFWHTQRYNGVWHCAGFTW